MARFYTNLYQVTAYKNKLEPKSQRRYRKLSHYLQIILISSAARIRILFCHLPEKAGASLRLSDITGPIAAREGKNAP